MSVVDLHVEPLLDRELAQPLTAAEQRVLDEHLAHCAGCRFERQARRDFAQSLQAAAETEGIDDLITRTLGEVGAASPSIRVAAERSSAPSLRNNARRGLLIGVFMLGSAAAAAFVATPLARVLPAFSSDDSNDAALSEMLDAVRQRVRSARLDHLRASAALPPDASRPQAGQAPLATAPGITAPRDEAAPGDEAAPAASETDAQARPPSAAALFARANKLRHAGKMRESLAAYSALDAKYPDSSEARLSKSIVARLLLDQGQANKAVQRYDEVLRTSPSNVEALMGRAGALRRLGQRAAEARTLRRVIAAQPNSPHAEAARTRLGELD